jgi:hypothetical protein
MIMFGCHVQQALHTLPITSPESCCVSADTLSQGRRQRIPYVVGTDLAVLAVIPDLQKLAAQCCENWYPCIIGQRNPKMCRHPRIRGPLAAGPCILHQHQHNSRQPAVRTQSRSGNILGLVRPKGLKALLGHP